MYFVRPNGLEVLESEVDLSHPDLLQVAYTQDFMVAYALVPQLKRALIVGLGGGGMLHALNRYDPQLSLDVVEIDPMVVQLARDYFGVDSTHARVITRDGFEQLRDPQVGQYDVIYMDAFLQPSGETDSTGAPLRLKTIAFLREVRERLNPEGALIINLNEHPQLRRDVRSLQEAFPALLLWRVPQTGNLIAVGFNSAERPSTRLLFERALRAEAQLNSPVRLTTILRRALSAEGL
jgi:spermidine synthase